MPEVLINLGTAYSGIRESTRSAECLDRALQLLEERAAQGAPGSPTSMISLRTALGQAAMAERDLARAEAELTIALHLARESKNRRAELTVHELLTTVHRRLGDFEKALTHRECQFDLHKSLFDKGSDLRIKALLIAHDSVRDRELLEAASAQAKHERAAAVALG
jgi:tetratricopeptide (TPR) repeat protein